MIQIGSLFKISFLYKLFIFTTLICLGFVGFTLITTEYSSNALYFGPSKLLLLVNQRKNITNYTLARDEHCRHAAGAGNLRNESPVCENIQLRGHSFLQLLPSILNIPTQIEYISKVTGRREIRPALFPEEAGPCEDRTQSQLDYMQHYAELCRKANFSFQMIKIKLVNMPGPSLGINDPGSSYFRHCTFNQCEILPKNSPLEEADMLLWDNYPRKPRDFPRNPKQLWVFHLFESPYNTAKMEMFLDLVNLTDGLRGDLTIPDFYFHIHVPLSKSNLVNKQDIITEFSWKLNDAKGRDYTANKTKLVAWVVSNCYAVRNGRFEYAQELARYIPVDIYGKCTGRSCGKDWNECFTMIGSNYKCACPLFLQNQRILIEVMLAGQKSAKHFCIP